MVEISGQAAEGRGGPYRGGRTAEQEDCRQAWRHNLPGRCVHRHKAP